MADYNALRAQTLGSAQEEEAVTVNTRALIDKVLARYSSENTTLRELLQNAADANASSVEVRFQTVDAPTSALSDVRELVRCKMRRMLVKNDGHPFREEDWQRLKRIAEGNPDETKIGAFGVGFYSVFADCEEPFVSSGDQAMAFYWKGNSLFTRRAKLNAKDPFTTFLLEYREPSELPDLRDLCRFFATSLIFVKLSSISLYINDHCLLSLNKKTSPAELLPIPETINPVTFNKLMRIGRVDTERVQIDAKFMKVTHYRAPTVEFPSSLKSIFARLSSSQPVPQSESSAPDDLASYMTATIFLRIATATVYTSIGTAFAKELERATKKPPPRTTSLAILSMSKDELDASEHNAEIFSNVLPSKAGKIFIGFPTHQTTGISAHISAPSVIPTVERENIDLNARVVRDWNIEMLRIGGILSRIMYTDEMAILARRAEALRGQGLEGLSEHAIHIMKQYTFTTSTPAGPVGRYIEAEFWSCSPRSSVEVMSTRGVLPSDQVRLSSDVTFLVNLPLLPEKIAKEGAGFVKGLTEMGLLTEITITDIRNGLGNQALSGAQLELFLKWLADKRLANDLDEVGVKSLLGVAVAMAPVPDSAGDGAIIPISLGAIASYVIPSRLASDVPLPPDCLPFHVTKSLTKAQLGALGWGEIAVYRWLQYICSQARSFPVEQNLELSAQFAHHVLAIVSKNWDQIPPKQKEDVVLLLGKKKCIPTKQGMKIPGEAYFNTVKLFADLPLVMNMHGLREKFLAALGVRKTVELKLVFERLMDGSRTEGTTKWSHVDLVKYLTSVSTDIPKDDITKLKHTAICKAEGPGSTLYKVSELYEPDDSLRKLRLPILQWPQWRAVSPEGKFLTSLGLKKHPSAEIVLRIAGNVGDERLREAALEYYVVNFYNNGYQTYNVSGLEIPFLPLAGSGGYGLKGATKLVAPKSCFSNPGAAIMGFQVLRKDLQQHAMKFGVKTDPDMKDCVGELTANPPMTTRAAREVFGYLSTRLAELVPHLVDRLAQAKIVPVPYKDDEIKLDSTKKLKMIPPRSCFLGDRGSQYFEIFDFVDFGQEANAFLLKCGSKHEPTVSEVAYMIVREPQRLLGVFRSSGKYLSVLRSIAENWNHLKRDKTLVKEMRKNAWLGALKETSSGSDTDPNAQEDDSGVIKEFMLVRVDQVLVVDDYVAYTLFKSEILAAPQEDILEMFYATLGAAQLSSKVTIEWHIGQSVGNSLETQKLSKLILERCRLFLHNNVEEALHDAKWLENNLKVSYVNVIRQRRTLRNEGGKSLTNSQVRTAAATKDKNSNNTLLFVTPGFQYYDVSQVLVQWILKRPKPHSALLLESLLNTDLMVLKSRGFNVDRVLRAKAEEARVAESQRLKRLEQERRALEEQEKQHQLAVKAAGGQPSQQPPAYGEHDNYPLMPGAFTESPVRNPPSPTPFPTPLVADKRKTNNIFENIGKRFGFEKTEQIKNLLNLQNSPPQQQQQQQQQQQKLLPVGATPPPRPGVVETPTEPHRIKANLQRAVEASRSHDSDRVFSRPSTYEVKEEKSYCDSRRSHDVTYFGETAAGIKLFIDHNVQDKSGFVKKNTAAMAGLSKILKDIAEIYSLALTSLHIFYDESGTSIAFNTNGSIFCNLRFFLQLHAADVARGAWQQALVYWFVVLAHELAHNLVSDHSAQHSFYAETFVQEYFVRAMQKVQASPS